MTRRHTAFTEEEAAALMKIVLIGILLSSAKGAFDVSDEFKRILPDVNFTSIEDLLAKAWDGKP